MGLRKDAASKSRAGGAAQVAAEMAPLAGPTKPCREFTIRVVRGSGGAAIEVSGTGLATSMTLVPGDFGTVNMFKRTRSTVRSILSSCLAEMLPEVDADDADGD